MNNISARIKEYLSSVHLTKKEAVSKLGVNKYYYDKYTENVSVDFILKLHKTFPQLNIDWLITGRGQNTYRPDIFDHISRQENKIETLAEYIKTLENK